MLGWPECALPRPGPESLPRARGVRVANERAAGTPMGDDAQAVRGCFTPTATIRPARGPHGPLPPARRSAPRAGGPGPAEQPPRVPDRAGALIGKGPRPAATRAPITADSVRASLCRARRAACRGSHWHGPWCGTARINLRRQRITTRADSRPALVARRWRLH